MPDCAVYQMPPRASRCLPLLGPRLLERSCTRDDQVGSAGTEPVGDVDRERQVAAVVVAHLDPVEEHRRGLVDGAEVQQHPPAGHGEAVGDDELAAVPEQLVGLELPAHARQRRLGRERHQDAAVVLPGRIRAPAW